jgi:hypothetical protein
MGGEKKIPAREHSRTDNSLGTATSLVAEHFAKVGEPCQAKLWKLHFLYPTRAF